MAKKRSTPDPGLPAPGSRPIAARKLIADLCELIEATRTGVARAVYSAQVLLHWQVGHRILAEILRYKRAGYGEEMVATVSRQLAAEYGRGFAEKSLRRMIQFAQLFPGREVVAALSGELIRTLFSITALSRVPTAPRQFGEFDPHRL